MGASKVEAFLTYLAVDREIAASTQNQAFSALLFLFREVLQIPLKTSFQFVGAKRSKCLPVVLTKIGAQQIFVRMSGNIKLIVQLLYRIGSRVNKAVRLRVKDLDFEQHQIIVRDGKGAQDRVSILPESILEQLKTILSTLKISTNRICVIEMGVGDYRLHFIINPDFVEIPQRRCPEKVR